MGARPQSQIKLPVLLPFGGRAAAGGGLFRHHDGLLFVDLRARHGLFLVLLFVLWFGTAQAATTGGVTWAIGALFDWIPFILKGFWLNIVISLFAMTCMSRARRGAS